VLCLNAVSSSVSNSLTLKLTSDMLLNLTTFVTLLDCGSSDCFLETCFVQKYSLKTYDITPIPLRLFDGTTNATITQAIDLPIQFPTGERQTVTFYMTGLDSSCSAVLGHNWLTHYNPMIDWVLGSITFKATDDLNTAPQPILGPSSGTTSEPPRLCSALASPRISLINAAAFMRACSSEGSTCFQLDTATSELTGKATSPVTFPEPLDKVKANVPEVYHDYADVFNKARADTLAPH
jgi:Retroviral aspartyl protease